MTQSTIDFLLNNNVTIIQTIFGIIFLLVVFVILRSFKEDKTQTHTAPPPTSSKSRREEFLAEKAAEVKKADEAAAPVLPKEDSPLDDLDNLDDLMGADATQAQIDQTLANAAPAAAAPKAAPASDNGELAAALSEKEKVISDLKSELASLQEKLKAPAAAGDTAGLEGKVKELTEKLAEYEIIEDDIANLSFYKNENVKLKNELAKLKGEIGIATEAAIAEVAALAPTVKEAAPTPVPPPPPQAAPTPPTPPVSDDSILNEFEEAVKQKEALEKSMPATEAPPAAPITMKSDADLLKEFESAVERELGGVKPAPNTKPAPLEQKVEAKEAPKAPEKAEEINSNKLVEEMEALAQAKPPEVKDDGKDSNQKLIEEFENFVNKS